MTDLDSTNADPDLLLESLLDEIEVPPSMYSLAADHYEAVGDWLNRDGSPIASAAPSIFAQGSFALGTVVRPRAGDDYDVDAVCLLNSPHPSLSQHKLKQVIGDRLRANARYAAMLGPEKRRCWTLEYADATQFHLDILPALRGESTGIMLVGVPRDLAIKAIRITDNTLPPHSWSSSNPQGYAEWFKQRSVERLQKSAVIRGDVAPLPLLKQTSTLQRAVQALKRHRDARYAGDEDQPISIIITTIAARAYSGESNLREALTTLIPKMRQAITSRGGVDWIENPTDPRENFADKWTAAPRKKELFYEWLGHVERFGAALRSATSLEKSAEAITDGFGRPLTAAALSRFERSDLKKSAKRDDEFQKVGAIVRGSVTDQFDLPHRLLPRWPMRIEHRAEMSAQIRSAAGAWRTLGSGERCGRNLTVDFTITTTAQQPFRVYWQVINSGDVARESRDLRGEFHLGNAGIGGLSRREDTRYAGEHAVIGYLVRNGVCIARTPAFVVRIA